MNELEKCNGRIVEQSLVNFEMPPESDSQTTSSLIIAILRRWYIVMLVFLVICAIGIPALWFTIEPAYEVTGAIRVAPILTNIITGEADRGEISNYQSFMNTEAEMITSSQVVQRVVDDLEGKNLLFFESKPAGFVTKLKQTLKNTKTKSEPVDMLRRAISTGVITAVSDRQREFIRVTMKSTDPQEAQQIVDAFIWAYMAVEVSVSAQDQDRKLSVLENERRVLAEKLQRQRQTITQLAQEYGTVTLDGRQEMMLQRVSSLLAELTKIEARRINLEAQVQLLEQTNEQNIAPEQLLTMRQEYINNDPTLRVLTENIAQLDQELIVARQTFAETNPELKRRDELLQALGARLEQRKQEVSQTFDELITGELDKAGNQRLVNTQAELEQTVAYETRLREILAKEDNETIGLGRKQLTIQDLQYQLDLDKEMYDTVRRRIQELEMERKRPARVSVAYNADIVSVQDKRIKYTLALIFGAMAGGMLLAFLRDKADLSLRTPDDVAKRIGIRIIGTTTSPHTIKRTLLPKQVAEDYQTIRANLGLLDGGTMPKKLVVTSPGTQDGKTTFAINLATSMAGTGKKVLLIDGDLRKPDIAHLLSLPKGLKGLYDVLFGRNFEQAVYSVPSAGLDVLVPDSRDIADICELLALPQTVRSINIIGRNYDHVIIDTAPVLAFPDALLWARIADAVILTSFAGHTTAPDLRETKKRLIQIDAKVLGTILSNVRVTNSYHRYGYNYYAQNGRRKEKSKQAAKLLLPMQKHEAEA
ncbi:MAG: GumC family protein [Planctomycetota bacterium]|jgi:capsular exopolysaccharide synthesis family protein